MATLFEATFDEPLVSGLGFFPEGNRTSTETVDGRTALRSHLERDDSAVRSEVTPTGMDRDLFTAAGSQTANAKIGETYDYDVKIHIPDDWEADSTPEILTQWHDFPDSGEAWKNPAIALQIRPGNDGESRFVLETHADASRITPSGGRDRYDSSETFDLGPVDDAIGEWTDWKFRIKWGYTEDSGHLQVWRDGERLVNEEMATAFNDTHGPYWKLGVYKWAWGSGRDTGADSRTYHYDDIRITGGGDARSDDAPAEAVLPAGAAAVSLAGVPPQPTIDDMGVMA